MRFPAWSTHLVHQSQHDGGDYTAELPQLFAVDPDGITPLGTT
jgi:hypothetical protein